jgi:hypothetical protein
LLPQDHHYHLTEHQGMLSPAMFKIIRRVVSKLWTHSIFEIQDLLSLQVLRLSYVVGPTLQIQVRILC